MPIIINNLKVPKYKHTKICDYCNSECGNVDDDYLAYSGYNRGDPKFDIKCSLCNRHQIACNFFPGAIILGYGRVPLETLLEIKRKKEMAEQLEKRTTKTIDTVDWAVVEKHLNEGTCKVTKLAKEWNLDVAEFRIALVKKYGDKIIFKKGAKGGCFWAPQKEVKNEG